MRWREVETVKPTATRREAPLRAKDKDTTRRAVVAVAVVVVVEMAKTETAEVITSKAGRRASIVEATTTTGRVSKERREMAST